MDGTEKDHWCSFLNELSLLIQNIENDNNIDCELSKEKVCTAITGLITLNDLVTTEIITTLIAQFRLVYYELIDGLIMCHHILHCIQVVGTRLLQGLEDLNIA